MRIDHRYEVLRSLGEGGMGAVYLVTDEARGGLARALKTITNPAAARAFEDEFRLLSRLRHPNLAAVHDFGWDAQREQHYFTVDYVDGEPFDWAGAGLPFDALLDRAVQLCRTLAYVHDNGLLHCDVKPANALVERDSGRVRLLDFGLAMASPREEVPPRGTLAFMAPEWLRGESPDRRADLYGLGMLLYRATTGRFPFATERSEDILHFHFEEAARLKRPGPEVPAWWCGIVERLLAKQPEERYDSVPALVRDMALRSGQPLHLETEAAWRQRGLGGPWFGREKSLSALEEGLDEALAPGTPPALLLLEGEPGVGKSRLLQEIKRRGQLRGRAVLSLSAAEEDFGGRLGRDLGFLLGQDHALWSAHATVLAELEGAPTGTVDTHRRMVESLGDLLAGAASERPLVLLMDDGERASDLCCDVLSYTLHSLDLSRQRRESDGRLALVVALSGEGKAEGIGALAQHPGSQRLTLQRMSPEELRDYLHSLVGEAPAALFQELSATSGGNPGFALSLIEALRSSGALFAEGETLRFDPARGDGSAIPRDVESSLRAIVGRLTPDERETLLLLCLSAEPISADVLARARALDDAAIEAQVTTLEGLGLVRGARREGELRFGPASHSHARLVAQGADESSRQTAHEALLRAVSEQGPAPAPAATRAHHLEGAGRREAGAGAALEAVEEALARGAFDSARRWLARARAMAAGHREILHNVARAEVQLASLAGEYDAAVAAIELVLDDPEVTLSASERARWSIDLGEAHMRRGNHERGAQAFAAALAATPPEDAPTRAAAQAGLARLEFFRGAYDAARSHAETALEVGGETSDAALGLASVTLGLVEIYQGAAERAAPLLARAQTVFESLGERRELAFVMNAQGLARHREGDLEAAIPLYARSLELARATGDQRRETIAAMNLSVAYQRAGHYRESLDSYLTSYERAYRVQDHESLIRVANNLGNICRFLGRLEEAADWVARSLALADTSGATLYRGYNHLIRGEIELLSGDLDAAQGSLALAEALLRAEERTDTWLEAKLDQATWLRLSGRLEEAETVSQQVSQDAEVQHLDDHRARALLESAQSALAAPPGADNRRRGLRRALEALALVLSQDAPELHWLAQGIVARAYLANELADEARLHLARAGEARARLAERLPEDMRATFFERRDRQDLQRELDESAAALAASAATSLQTQAARMLEGDSLLRLLEINRELGSERRVDSVLNRIMDAIIELTGAERGFIILRREQRLEIEVARNMDREAIRRSKEKISHSIAEQVIQSGEALHTYDAQEDERYRDYVSIHALRLRSIACYPLKERGESFGAIYLDNRFKAHAFDERQRALLEAFAAQAAVAITNARLHEHNERILGELQSSRDQIERLNHELEQKLVDQGALLEETREALTRRQDQLEARYRYGQIIGSGPAMQVLYDLIDRVKDLDISVVIQGESGTGKELVARAVHYNGVRRKQDFVSINCAAFPESLLESELFGHKRGSFTGADRDKKGLFQVAHRGTLFLDEVGDMSLGMQAKLLRALQEREVRPVGGHESVKVDVRVIAASNQDLKELIRQGRFREDLYYRLNVVTVRVPPLRERREDIGLLVEHFLDRAATRTGEARKSISPEALRVLARYGWPGNVRELESTVTTATLFAPGARVEASDLANKPELLDGDRSEPQRDLGERSLADLEREAIVQALIRTKGNKMAAASALGISRRSLYNKLKQYDIRLTKKTTVQR